MSPALEALMQADGTPYPGKGVMLEPFVHQVGGHSCVLRFGEQTICKPLIPREHQFYKSLPTEMRKFTPQYKGVVSVSFEEDEEGNLCLIAYPLRSESGDLENKDPSTDCEPKSKILKWSNKKHSPLHLDDIYSKERARHCRKDDKIMSYNRDEMQQPEVLYFSLEKGNMVPQIKHNPWSLKCHQQHLQRMKENAKHRNQYKFILLENLTWSYKVPCVLDLKMGTRQHGDDASEEKKANQIRKCQQSTSASIGVRLCGMQVYQSDVGQLMFMNKYHGRKLTLAGFKEALYQFFHDGCRLRRELLSPVLRRLREMQAALEACESYRFYSSSLLIIYDGDPPRTPSRPRHRGGEDGDEDEPSDEEEDEEEEEEEGAFGFPRSSSAGGNTGGSSNGGGGGRSSHSPGESSSPAVDVRMIDFAHTTCRHYGEDSVVHEGQDSGFIFGLQNLVTIISQLEDHSTE
ncbi:inositol hexakisphosphate kinase 2 [Takifugu rubripes]|uniref:Kinase n=2 Tax=Takifugu TaxID=31032 RepID=A0A3B5KG02_TAKRU|nr:inositol hexakisphosphate kinase 2 [Takifugu rubripes]XP_056886969.1 inositol hexakisphosphate kinase 2b [Takifugu flavidus]|eukprot:XP_003973217.1 PREDICTED: inositol hexakisphosphate kinase 2-like [Takifugu rubripes]